MKKIAIAGGIIGAVAVLAICGSLMVVMQTKGKKSDEVTNKSSDMEEIDRGTESVVKADSITYEDMTASYKIPDGFYFEDENRYMESGVARDYMDHNYTKSIEVDLYKVHNGDVALIDENNSENSVIYKDITIDADEWLREMQLVYLEREDASDIYEATENGRNVRYFTEYEKSDEGIMRGMVVGVISLDDDYYYCVKVVEYDQKDAPEYKDYADLFCVD